MKYYFYIINHETGEIKSNINSFNSEKEARRYAHTVVNDSGWGGDKYTIKITNSPNSLQNDDLPDTFFTGNYRKINQ